METRLKIALQKSGRLSEKSLELIRDCGIHFSSNSRVLKEAAENFPIEFLYLRDDDIPSYVYDGVADIGIVGRNEHDEQNFPLEIVRDLGFAKCRLSIAVPNSMEYEGLKSLDGKRIATSYPTILQKKLKEANVQARIYEISGSVEITPSIGVADAICDLVSTGATLVSNGLKEVEPIYTSTAVMIAHPGLDDLKRGILDRLLLRLDAVMKAADYKYIMFNLPKEHLDEVASIIGGMKSPTVTPLLDENWVSVQTVVHEQRFWDALEKLKELKAMGILVTSIEKMAD
ncbi:MAG: ATP phosphoribosyltransferase [Sphaerochaetaceae bacterium]|nr:ATP phosphoribosyltransferase [Sphaerochaetaceae bacterium]